MARVTLEEFADKVSEIMPAISKEFLRHQTGEFYRMKITLPQFIVLELLSRHGASKMTDIAHFMNVTTAAMTGIVDRLVRDGYAARASDPDDRRIIMARLTPKGLNLVKKMVGHRRRMTMKIFGMVSQAEREEYLKILTHIRDHITER